METKSEDNKKEAIGLSLNKLLANWTISKKLAGGFGLVGLIIIVIVALVYAGLQETKKLSTRISDLRAPTAQASMKVLNGINYSLAGLRGWMLLGNEKFKQDRADGWSDWIDAGYGEMLDLSKSWTNPENVERLKAIEPELELFRQYQEDIESMANTDENVPAFKMLLAQAAPQAGIMSASITKIIDLELARPATQARKNALGMMADVRGTLGLGLADIRAYLLSGNEAFRENFRTLWKKNDRRFKDLTSVYGGLSADQKKAFDRFAMAREKFVEFPERMFSLRGGEDWNLANFWLKQNAAPLANSISQAMNAMVANRKYFWIRITKI